MTDVVDRDRQPSVSRLSRVRCIHCHMPTGATQPRCWSCGLDPTGPADGDAPPEPAAPRSKELPGPWHSALLGAAAATLVVVALLGTVLMLDPQEEGQGVRGIAARIHGATWPRAQVAGATAEFPARPVRSTAPLEVGPSGTAEVLVAAAPGVRVELRATTLDRPLSPTALMQAYGAATGRKVTQEGPAPVRQGTGVDAVLDGPDGPCRVRAIVAGASAYLLAVTGPSAAFERFTASFSSS